MGFFAGAEFFNNAFYNRILNIFCYYREFPELGIHCGWRTAGGLKGFPNNRLLNQIILKISDTFPFFYRFDNIHTPILSHGSILNECITKGSEIATFITS
jgi:hypothetical protein